MNQNKKDNYHIISLIGKGAYGDVYKARRKFTGQFVAIKTIKKKGKPQRQLKNMREQCQILKKLKHQNIILLLDSFETNTELILVTELGQGQLFNLIQDDQFIQEPQIRSIAQQLVRALNYLHSNRITHRDIKPQNILMASDGTVKLCDFGFARNMSIKTQVLTSLKGTPLYMAPQVVQQQPYTHTADLWSLGVILYQLATGTPPFTAPNLMKLVQHISNDPIIYPDTIQGQFKTFLKGLLNKDPQKRLGWPDLLNHPFIKQTQVEKMQRKKKNQSYSIWTQDNNHIGDEDTVGISRQVTNKTVTQNGFDDRSRDLSLKTQLKCGDSIWDKYLDIVNTEKGPNQLRSDTAFLQQLLKTLSTNINQIVRVKQKKIQLQCALKVLTQVLMKSKNLDPKKIDISKNVNIPTYLLTILKSMLKIQGKISVDIISDITKLIGLLAKITFNKNLGIQNVYLRSFLPLLSLLCKTCLNETDQTYQTLTINLLRTTGIFANNASANHVRSFTFYRDIVQIRFLQECMDIIKHYSENMNVLKIVVQVFSAFMHPVYGDIQCFPWKKKNNSGIAEFKQCITMLECVRQSVINCLLQNQGNWMEVFAKILVINDQTSLLPKISIERIILQSLRQSKEFAQYLLFNCFSANSSSHNNILLILFQSLQKGSDPIAYGTTCLIIGHLIKFAREKKRQRLLESAINQVIVPLFQKYLQFGKNFQNTNNLVGLFGIFFLLQQIINIDGGNSSLSTTQYPNMQTINRQNSISTSPAFVDPNSYFEKVLAKFLKEQYVKIASDFLSTPNINKIEEIRKLQGSNYGVHIFGMYDTCISFLHRLLNKLSKENDPRIIQLSNVMTHCKIQSKIANILRNLSSKTDLSPKGLISLLMLVYLLLVNNKNVKQFAQQTFLCSLLGLLKQSQIQSLLQWPVGYGGGQTCVQILFGNLMKIFLVYLQQAEKSTDILKIFYQENLVEIIIRFANNLPAQSINSIITSLGHLLSFDREKTDRSFVKQFIDAGGMALFVRFQLLKFSTQRTEAQSLGLLQSVNLLSQIARSSKDTYQIIFSMEPFNDIKKLLKINDKNVKSRLLNLLGNMCRHSSYFYSSLKENPQIIDQCIKLCSDNDKTIKKFACVVLGNASFHDDSLYQLLEPGIKVLVSLLKDPQEKTRSNAAAALGNLSRNSNKLDKQFIKCGANHQLVNMFVNDKSISAKKVSAMAITNLLGLPESNRVLKDLNIKEILMKYVPPNYNGDQGLIKTVHKAIEKIQ